MRHLFVASALSLTTLLSAAQTFPSGLPNPLAFLSNILSPKAAKLSKLLDEKNLLEADKYLATEHQYFFVENKKDQIDLLRRLSIEENAFFEPYMTASIAALSRVGNLDGQTSWELQRETLRVATNLVREYKTLQIYTEPEFRTKQLAELEAAIAALTTSLTVKALAAFEAFDHDSASDFFAVYPQNLPSTFLIDNAAMLQDFIQTRTAPQITSFKSKYAEKIGNSGSLNELLLARYFQVTLLDPAVPSLGQVLSAVDGARAAGFTVKTIPGMSIAFVEITSKTLLSEGQIEFPTEIDMDLPFESTKTSVDSVLDATERIGASIIIVLDVAASKVSRRVIAKIDLNSRYISGQRSDPNPAYDVARTKLFEAQNGLANLQSQPAYGVAAAVIKGIAVIASSANAANAQKEFSNTSPMIKSNEYQSYKYSTSDVGVTRALTANYYVIDKKSNNYFKGTVDISENKSFKVAYSVHDNDPERESILSRFGKESDVASYEQSPVTLPISLLIKDYLKNENQGRPLQSIASLRSEMLTDKNKALTAYKSTQYTATAINDSRFDSVVVVLNPKGPLGTGFFVAPDLVLTNYHVVEGAQFIEMKLYNGLETFGKVVKTDVRLDLALVRVQTRGVPVIFYQENNLDLGATVEAIGHPKGLTFTITRGIISAVRKRPSGFAVGGKDVLFVQTDAAINPGNSGGPLFLGGRVVGVNNNKLAAGSEGLGFSVHYSEVIEFLKDSF